MKTAMYNKITAANEYIFIKMSFRVSASFLIDRGLRIKKNSLQVDSSLFAYDIVSQQLTQFTIVIYPLIYVKKFILNKK